MRWLGAVCCVVVVGCVAEGERMEALTTTSSSSTSTSTSTTDPPVDSGDCHNGALYFGPEDLPAAYLGEPYSVDVRDYAESGWWGAGGYSAWSDPPPGLQWSEDDTTLSGTPTELGLFELTVDALHGDPGPGECSTHPDPHEFNLLVTFVPDIDTETDTDTNGGTDTDSSTGGTTGGTA